MRLTFNIKLLGLLLPIVLTACAWLPEVGPSRGDFSTAAQPNSAGRPRIALIDINPGVVSAMEKWSLSSLQGTFGDQRPARTQVIGIGDYLQIVLWEVSPGGLFSAPALDRLSPGSRSAVIPEQVVGADGAVTVPYAGRIPVAGRTPSQVETTIVDRLQGKAVEPQALVTVTKNVANTVTVLGEVTGGARVPLTTRGDRILDVIASAGGTKTPAYETFLTLTRGGRSVRVPMQAILTDPKEDIYVMPGDVVTVARQPQTFTAVGATGKNDVLPFISTNITLEQAIGQAGGLNDSRADPAGVFVIRFEDAASYDQLGYARPSPDHQVAAVPVVYRLDLRDPNAFFLASRFPIHNKDILYVSNASATEIGKVGNIVATFLIPAGTVVAVGALARTP